MLSKAVPQEPHPVAVEGRRPRHPQGRGRGHHRRDHAHHPEKQKARGSDTLPTASPPAAPPSQEAEGQEGSGRNLLLVWLRKPGCLITVTRGDKAARRVTAPSISIRGSESRQSWPLQERAQRRPIPCETHILVGISGCGSCVPRMVWGRTAPQSWGSHVPPGAESDLAGEGLLRAP